MVADRINEAMNGRLIVALAPLATVRPADRTRAPSQHAERNRHEQADPLPRQCRLVLSLAAGAAIAGVVRGADDAVARIQAAGYAEIRELEYDDGLWEAEVRLPDGRWHDVAVDGRSGELLDERSGRPILGSQDILARLAAAGYADVRDVDLEDAIWEIDARRADGSRVELRVNAHTGAVISESFDD